MPEAASTAVDFERALRRLFQIRNVEEERALARSLVYRFLCTACRHPETGVLSSRDALLESLPAALNALQERGDYKLTDSFIRLTLALRWCDAGTRREANAFRSRLGPSDRAGGPVPGAPVEEHLALDSIAAECELAASLCAQEAAALRREDEDLAALFADAQRNLLGERLAWWVPAFTRWIERRARDEFRSELARFTRAWIAEECRRLGIDSGSRAPTLTRGA